VILKTIEIANIKTDMVLRDGWRGHTARSARVVAFAALVWLTALPVFAGSVTVGTQNENNCIPFSCANQFGVTEDQQVYSSAAFSGPIAISSFDMYVLDSGTAEGETFNIYFSTTSAPVNGLSSNLAANVGADNQFFGQYIFTPYQILSGTLVFSGATFNYNPTAGNLLMTVLISNFTGGVSGAAVASDYGDDMSRATNTAGPYYEGDVTTFNSSVSSAPEPATTVLLGGSLLVFAAVRRLCSTPDERPR